MSSDLPRSRALPIGMHEWQDTDGQTRRWEWWLHRRAYGRKQYWVTKAKKYVLNDYQMAKSSEAIAEWYKRDDEAKLRPLQALYDHEQPREGWRAPEVGRVISVVDGPVIKEPDRRLLI